MNRKRIVVNLHSRILLNGGETKVKPSSEFVQLCGGEVTSVRDEGHIVIHRATVAEDRVDDKASFINLIH